MGERPTAAPPWSDPPSYIEGLRQVFATHDCWHDTDPQAPAAVREGRTNVCRRCGAAGHKLYLQRCGDG